VSTGQVRPQAGKVADAAVGKMANWSAARTGVRLDSKSSADGSSVLSEAMV
jgi:hypothetical protein